MFKVRTIRPLLGFSRLPDADLLSRFTAIEAGVYGNPDFPSPPVEAAVFKAGVADYAAAIAAALDGGKKAIAERGKCREVLIPMSRFLGAYVEHASNGDLTTFLSSGFVAAPLATRGAAQLLAQPVIARIDNGLSGQLLVTLKAVPKARHYEVRYASVPTGGVPGAWTSILAATTEKSVPCNSLTPGTTYAFQVRAYNKVGYTDWSDSLTRMCM